MHCANVRVPVLPATANRCLHKHAALFIVGDARGDGSEFRRPMNNTRWRVSVALSLLAACAIHAQVPADAPPGATALCKDGMYYNGTTKSDACRGHRGIKDWYLGAPAAPAAPVAPVAPTAPAAAMPAAAPTAPPAPAAPVAKVAGDAPALAPQVALPDDGPVFVWVNTRSKVYHCQGDKWYGKSKQGRYLPEADAQAQGNRPDRGKPCNGL